MQKEDYIKAIEELNKEHMELYYSNECRIVRRKKRIKNLLKKREFKKLYITLKTSLLNNSKRYNKIIKQEQKLNEKSGKKVIYTCITGDYDPLMSPVIETTGVDYIVFSDNEQITKGTKYWKFRPITEEIKNKCNNNLSLINRYIKMHPKEVLPEYDLSLYIDGSVRVISDITDCFNYINDKTGLALHDHAKRNDVYEESQACIRSSLGNKKNIKQLIKKYKEENFPEKFGLFEATMILTDLKNKTSKQILDMWWEEHIKNETLRDQLSFTYVLWKNNFKCKDVGILGPNASTNPKFRRYEHIKNTKKERLRTKIKRYIKLFISKFCQTKMYIKIIRPIVLFLNKIRFYGKTYTCNICKSNLRTMLYGGHEHPIFIENEIVGAGFRENYKCPVCKSKDKERLVYYYIENYTNILTGKNTVLHFAPEFETKKRIKKNKKAIYYNGDLDEKKADMKVDITNICFKENTFDYIICNHVLEHVIDEKKAFEELKRVIKKDGKIILTVPVCISNDKTIEENLKTKEERMAKFCQEDHVRLYGNDITKRIKKYGFKVEEYDFYKKEGEELFEKYGMLENGIIYILTK